MDWVLVLACLTFGIFLGQVLASRRSRTEEQSRAVSLRQIRKALKARNLEPDRVADVPEECLLLLERNDSIGAIGLLRREKSLSLKDARDRIRRVLADDYYENLNLLLDDIVAAA